MDFNRNLRIVRTSGPSYPFPYKSNVLWVHHDENNNPIIEIWDHGKWVPVTVIGSGATDYTSLTGKPSINGHMLEGDMTSAELGLVGSRSVSAVVALTSVEYNSLKEKDPSTLYVITGGSGDED